MKVEFGGEIWYWRGPSPFYFVTVPPDESEELHTISELVSYGWGMIPVTANIGTTTWTTSLFPKNNAYVVPLKRAVRDSEQLDVGDRVEISLFIEPTRREP